MMRISLTWRCAIGMEIAFFAPVSLATSRCRILICLRNGIARRFGVVRALVGRVLNCHRPALVTMSIQFIMAMSLSIALENGKVTLLMVLFSWILLFTPQTALGCRGPGGE